MVDIMIKKQGKRVCVIMEYDKIIGREIVILSGKIKRKLMENKNINDRQLSHSHSRILGYIVEHDKEDVFQRDIEKHFMTRRATISKIIKSLEEKKYIFRESVVSDGRLKKIIPTEKALNLYRYIHKDIAKKDLNLISGISEAEMKTFMSVLHKISKNLD